MEQRPMSAETLAAQGLGEADPISGGLAPVINLSTNYEQQPDGSYPQGRVYTRADNPTSEHAEQLLAALEGGALESSYACALFGSGMAAATAVCQSLLPGDHVLVSRVLYWGVRKWLAEFALTWGLDVEFTDTADLATVAAAIRPGRTRLLWVETPANPMWEITDLAAVCGLAHAAGGSGRGGQHGGHAGADPAVRVRRRPGDPLGHQVPQRARRRAGRRGAGRPPGSVLGADPVLAPQRRRDAGGVRGLAAAARHAHAVPAGAPRLTERSEIATCFQGHPALAAVLYPGLPDHPGHEIAARQMRGGFGGMLSIQIGRAHV